MTRHRTDPVSLIIGLIFVSLAVWWLLVQVTDAVVPAVGWLITFGLILLGVLGLVVNVRADLHRPPQAPGGGSGGDTGAPDAG
jgi:hypothetical protein